MLLTAEQLAEFKAEGSLLIRSLIPDAVLAGSHVNVEAAVDALSGDLGTSGKEGTGSLARKDAVAKWRRSKHRFDAMDDLSKKALRKYGYSVRERRRRKPS